MSTILLANAYYDIRTGTPWTPYLGGGVGFAVNQVTRNVDYTNTVTDETVSAGNRTTDVQFAAAAMAGVSYDFSSFFAIDVNYRFLHIGGSEVSLKPDVSFVSRDRRPQRAPDPRRLPVLRELAGA